MKKTSVTYIVSDIDKALAFEWVAVMLPSGNIDLEFLILGHKHTYLEKFLIAHGVRVRALTIKGKSSYLTGFFKLWLYLLKTRPDVIHCHLRRAELIGMTAGFLARIKSRIYTRHSSTYNHLYHPKGVFVDRIINRMATRIVAISQNVKSVLTELEGVRESKICLIRHGFDLELFSHVPTDAISHMKRKYGLEDKYPVIGIIGRYTWWKGYRYSIPALAAVMKEYPKSHVVLANAIGNHADEIRQLIRENFSPDRYTEIEFENNIPALYHTFDVYVHVPIDPSVEAFGQTYVEALASGVPSVFTLSGIAREFIRDRYNALVVDFKNPEQIESAVSEILGSAPLRNKLIKNGQKSIEIFSLDIFIEKLTDLYQNMPCTDR